MKTCCSCNELKEESEFPYVKAIKGLHSWCKVCRRKNGAAYYKANNEAIIKKRRIRSDKIGKDIIRYRRYVRERLKMYGLTEQNLRDMMDVQRGCCDICGLSLDSGKKNILHVDHCHRTGEVRSLLCDICNVGLGHFKDNSSVLRRAADYVDKHSK